MAMTVQDLNDALSSDFQALWLMDDSGRHWRIADCACGTAIRLALYGCRNSDYLVGVNAGGDIFISATEDLLDGVALSFYHEEPDAMVLSGNVIGASSPYACVNGN